jgi:hypothetical protein
MHVVVVSCRNGLMRIPLIVRECIGVLGQELCVVIRRGRQLNGGGCSHGHAMFFFAGTIY